MTTVRATPSDFGWLVSGFADRVPGVAHALVVSSDGLPLALSRGLPVERADQLAAVTSGLISLVQGAARLFAGGEVVQSIIEMDGGVLIAMSVSDGSCLTVLASPTSDIGLVAYEMTRLVNQVGELLTPDLRDQLRGAGGR